MDALSRGTPRPHLFDLVSDFPGANWNPLIVVRSISLEGFLHRQGSPPSGKIQRFKVATV